MRIYAILLLLACAIGAQGQDTDSLYQLLQSKKGKARLPILDDLSWNLCEQRPKEALELALEQQELAHEFHNDTALGNAYANIAGAYWMLGNYPQAIENYTHGMAIRGQLGDRKGAANLLNNMGIIYRNMGNYQMALESYLQALRTYEEVGESQSVTYGNTLNNIGIIYKKMGDAANAEVYYRKAIEIYTEKRFERGLAFTFANLGLIYLDQQKFEYAIPQFTSSLAWHRNMKNAQGAGLALINLSDAYRKWGKLDSAAYYAQEALNQFTIAESQAGLANAHLTKAKIMQAHNDWGNLEKEAQLALGMAQKVGDMELQRESHELLAKAYRQLGQFERAFMHLSSFHQSKDSLVSEEVAKQIANAQSGYEIEKRNLQIANLEQEHANDLMLRFIIIGSLAIALLFIVILYNRNQLKTKANRELSRKNREIMQQKEEILQQKEEIESQRDQIEEQRDEIEAQAMKLQLVNRQIESAYTNITDSISYAKRIQGAILGQEEKIISQFEDAFILLMPKDVVSGDFYWFFQFPATDPDYANQKIVVCADCTGHGVPGAMMTVIGNTLLNEIVKVNRVSSPDKILAELDRKIRATLHQTDSLSQQDGMDITILNVDIPNRKALFSGAKNPLALVRNGELERIKGSKYSIGGEMDADKSFEAAVVELRPNDRLYLYSDGYQDQFGGLHDTKFMSKRFRDLLRQVSELPMSEQKEKLVQTFHHWKGEQEQTDDVLIMGMKF